MLKLTEYNLETDLRRDRNDTSARIGGGLLVYTRRDIRVLPCESYTESKFNQFCAFEILMTGEQLNLILTYRSPSSGQNNTAELCEILRKMDNNTILIGDINMSGIDWEEEQTDSKGRE